MLEHPNETGLKEKPSEVLFSSNETGNTSENTFVSGEGESAETEENGATALVLRKQRNYVLKKQREKWTDEEHHNFVTALNMLVLSVSGSFLLVQIPCFAAMDGTGTVLRVTLGRRPRPKCHHFCVC